MGNTTVVAVIHGDDPRLRPGLPRSVRADVSSIERGAVSRRVESFEVTFSYGGAWDVARINSRLELRYEHETTDPEFRKVA